VAARLGWKFLLATLMILVAAAFSVSTASAGGSLLGLNNDCGLTSQPFAQFGDYRYYTFGANGGLENGATGWSLSGARVVSGNESSYVHGTGDDSSVLIPQGGTVTTGPICVGLDKPTVRFFAKRPSFSLLPLLTVEGVFTTKAGTTASLPMVGVPVAGNSWSLQLPFVTTGAVLELGDTTMMRFRIRAVTGAWQVDDLYVDPMRRY